MRPEQVSTPLSSSLVAVRTAGGLPSVAGGQRRRMESYTWIFGLLLAPSLLDLEQELRDLEAFTQRLRATRLAQSMESLLNFLHHDAGQRFKLCIENTVERLSAGRY